MTLDDVLGNAYRLDQVGGDRAAAVAAIRQALSDSDIAAAAATRLPELKEVVRVRKAGGQDGCHVSRVCADLLTLATD